METSIIKRTLTEWILINGYNLAVGANEIVVDLSGYNEFLVQFGDRNGTQAYGGMTYVDTLKNTTDSKPSFLPIYSHGTFEGTIYIYQGNNGMVTLKNDRTSGTIRAFLFAR